ncbi:MAG: Fic family protein [Clostridia bacterium]|nr:Fic family protein [Clostridia bacterium]
MKNRAGEYKTNLSGELQYKSFLPKKLPPNPPIDYDKDIIHILSKTNRSLGILEGISSQVPNVNLFVSMYVKKEALLSSQIEGTQATLEDILDPDVEENTNRHVADVINYIKAFQYGKKRLNDLPISSRLLKEIHEVLMCDVRGSEKNPGEFRRSQNWIGSQGSTLKNAKYVPPNVEDMIEAISEFEKFLNEDDDIDPLIKIGLAHYQFETIHPFLDGNGRIGRLLITLFLMERKVLSYETLYISYFLKRNRIEYYDRMMEVRTKGNYEQWIKFFLLAVYESSEDAIKTIRELEELHNKSFKSIEKIGRASKTVRRVLKYLESNPIIDIKKTSSELEISYNAVSNAVNHLVKLEILRQTDSAKRNRAFSYERYLKIMRKDT